MSDKAVLPPQLSPHAAHHAIISGLRPALSYRSDEDWKRQARDKLAELVRMPRTHPGDLKPTILWSRQTAYATIQKLSFEVEPNHQMIAYWCRPTLVQENQPTLICMQGHNSGMHVSLGIDFETESKPIKVNGDRDLAIQCLHRGYSAFCLEQRAFGYRRENILPGRRTTETTCHDAQMGAMLLGRTLIGERVYDVQCAARWLATQDRVDPSKIGTIGQSGGGTTGIYSIALLDEISFCIASCCFAPYADSIAGRHHCCCNVIPDVMNWFEFQDVVALAAPKRVVLVNGISDDIFPIESARRGIKIVQKAYADQNASQYIAFCECPGGHDFHARQAWEAFDRMSAIK